MADELLINLRNIVYPPSIYCSIDIDLSHTLWFPILSFTIHFSVVFILHLISLLSLSLEEGVCYDSLTIKGIYDKEFCGKRSTPDYSPKVSVVRLTFQSDESNGQKGFDISYTSTLSKQCLFAVVYGNI